MRQANKMIDSGIGFENDERVQVVDFNFPDEDIGCDKNELRKGIAFALSKIIELIITDTNPHLVCWCYRFVMQQTDKSQIEIGDMFHVTKAAVSNRVILLCKVLKIPPSRSMRSKSSRIKFAFVQREIFRKRKIRPTDSSNMSFKEFTVETPYPK